MPTAVPTAAPPPDPFATEYMGAFWIMIALAGFVCTCAICCTPPKEQQGNPAAMQAAAAGLHPQQIQLARSPIPVAQPLPAGAMQPPLQVQQQQALYQFLLANAAVQGQQLQLQQGRNPVPLPIGVMQGPPQQQQLPNPIPEVTGFVVKYQKATLEAKYLGEECAICCAEFEKEDSCKILSKCKHVYHEECIDLWLEQHRHCPLCRGSVRGGRSPRQNYYSSNV